MTTLIGKLQNTSKRLQQLTVWRVTERDPLIELDRWRTDAHIWIEQIYLKKRQQIEQLMDKHEREFMRQISRQRTLLMSIRQRLAGQKEMNSHIQTQNDTSILTDLQRIENDINTKLGRAEILVEIKPLNIEDSVIISLKTYLSATSSLFIKEMSTINQSKKRPPRSTDQVTHAYENWLDEKKKEETLLTQTRLQSARQYRERHHEEYSSRQKNNQEAFGNWVNFKKAAGAFVKKQVIITDNDTTQETNET